MIRTKTIRKMKRKTIRRMIVMTQIRIAIKAKMKIMRIIAVFKRINKIKMGQ